MATIQNKGPFRSLVAQLDKLARHNRQGSFRTKARYYEACKRFCAYLAAEYHLQKLENISGKHLVSYVLYLQDTGKSASTVKTDLAAIRFFHDKMSRPKYTLPTNSELGVELERRRFGQLDRTWSGPEFNRLLGKAMAENRDDVILALYLGRYAGLRIHECFRMDTAAAEQALRENALTVKGKGGKVRTVPIEDERILMMLRKPFRKNEMDILAYLPFLCFRNGQLHTGTDGNACDNLSLMPTQETGFLMIDFKLFLPNDLFNQRQYLLRRKDIS